MLLPAPLAKSLTPNFGLGDAVDDYVRREDAESDLAGIVG
jgi:hypothetical protein